MRVVCVQTNNTVKIKRENLFSLNPLQKSTLSRQKNAWKPCHSPMGGLHAEEIAIEPETDGKDTLPSPSFLLQRRHKKTGNSKHRSIQFQEKHYRGP